MPAAPELSPSLLRAIALLALGSFVSAATMRVADPLLPQVAAEFQSSVSQASIIVTAFSIAYGVCQLVYGPLGDRYGKYRLVAITMLLSSAGVIACALAPDLAALGAARLLSGATAAAIIPLSMAFIGDSVPYEHRQAVIARFLTGQILGMTFGQIFGGVLGEYLDWRAIFLLLGLIYVLAAAALFHQMRRPGMIDPRGSDSLRPSVLAARYADLLRRPHARLVLATVFTEGFLFFGGFAYVGAFIAHDFEMNYAQVGMILGVYGVGAISYALLVKRLVFYLGERGLAICGGGLVALCFIGLALSPVWQALVPATLVTGFGFYMFHNTLQTNATQMAPEARGFAVSSFACAFFLGQAAGVAICGHLAEAYGYRAVLIATGLALAALGFIFGRTRPGRP
jgi:predicted MFS family arabinose efflux permease